MAQVMLWKVIREHEGDRRYAEGETREGPVADLGHLDGTVLELIGPKPADTPAGDKSEGSSEKNKAEGASAADKADRAPANKARKPRKQGT